MEKALTGIVTGIDGRTSTVRTPDGEALRCELRAAIRTGEARTNRVAVGDRVAVARTADGAGVIEAVEPRRSKLSRGRGKAEQVIAANVDQLAIVVSTRDPDWRPGFADRMICAAHKGELEPLVIANKVDLLDDPAVTAPEFADMVRRDLDAYRALGYRCIETSAAARTGLDALRAALEDRLTVFSGQSGVGKSSLLNTLEDGLALATREVSRGTRKGRHTTTTVTLLPLQRGGFVLDTPGVRSFAFYDLDAREVGWLFKDVAALAPSCKFRDCLHLDEPECAVRYAAENGVLDERRYESYTRIIASLDEDVEDPRA
jgi:ribosome biogenesis GTPase